MGPLMIDVGGTTLTAEDREILQHPYVGGLILFTRNYEAPQQVAELVSEIRRAAGKPLLIAVDHEGGRVQRFRAGFSQIPTMASFWQQTADSDPSAELACQLATEAGFLMASEVRAVGIDISFSPVLDLYGISEVIGDRAFHQQPDKVSQIGAAFIQGMHRANMKTTGKHFPGHGSVLEDSHIALPIDNRSQTEILANDFAVFEQLMQKKLIDATMPAHVIYPAFDPLPVGFSPYWIQQVLRQQLKFDGVVFSDDLTMEGAKCVGGVVERAEASWQAGCDMLLICNSRTDSIKVIDQANLPQNASAQRRLTNLLTPFTHDWASLPTCPDWQQARQKLKPYFQLDKA